ncbi:hypothetical protein EJ994_12815 [Maribacter sp. MJ134]|uniref:outer membrane protein n=1 Tax=Maribacter sp. MJ134 TaxID=2496865 RepID=UPI000F83D71A|nr:outer membrane beta-barrel protein [Maribacter sp. MJ134]AZQ59644.1 hypothetical protein EJ994_12815 [Maribacter sp. MJ134]
MKKIIIFALLIIVTSKLFSQNEKFGIEVNYPVLIDNNFIGVNYNGIIDLGLSYSFINTTIADFGVNFNTSIFRDSNKGGFSEIDITVISFQPSIYGEFKINGLQKFRPIARLGYTLLTFSNVIDFSTGEEIESNTSRGGLNLGLGVAYQISNRVFLKFEYDFTKLYETGRLSRSPFNTNINILAIGLSYKL